MRTRERLLRTAVERLVDERGFRPIRTLKDRGGTHCYVMKNGGEQFYVVAKKEAWNGTTASILQKTARRAKSFESPIICYFHNDGEFRVFDGDYVVTEGVEKVAKSKTHVTAWFEVPLNVGVPLHAYLTGADRPRRIDRSRDTTLSSFE
jgi:hypothetical protein